MTSRLVPLTADLLLPLASYLLGFDNLAHEDLGQWSQGEPNLVDEHGDAWRFVNGVNGVRKEKMARP